MEGRRGDGNKTLGREFHNVIILVLVSHTVKTGIVTIHVDSISPQVDEPNQASLISCPPLKLLVIFHQDESPRDG